MRRRCVKSTTKAVMPHARSLAPLVKAQGFGMTPQFTMHHYPANFGDPSPVGG